MKTYQKNQLLISISFIFFLIFIYVVFLAFQLNYKRYQLITGIVVSQDNIIVVVNNKELKYLTSTKNVYLDGNKKKIKIIRIVRNIVKKNKLNYNEVTIKIKIAKKYKYNDTLEFSVYKDKKSIINLLIKCFKTKEEN